MLSRNEISNEAALASKLFYCFAILYRKTSPKVSDDNKSKNLQTSYDDYLNTVNKE